MEKIYDLVLNDKLDPTVFARLLPLLSPEKQARICRNRFDADKKRGLYAALLVRAVACQMLGVPNRTLQFAEGSHGKPYLIGYPDFHYNVSHTDNAVAVAVCDSPIGIDIERIKPAPLKIAERYFTAAERAYIYAASSNTDRRFFEVWTKKEAYIKQTGAGLSAALQSFCVQSGVPSYFFKTFARGDYLISVCRQAPICAERPIPLTENELITLVQHTLIPV